MSDDKGMVLGDYTTDMHRELESVVNDLDRAHMVLGHQEPAFPIEGNGGCCSCGVAAACRRLWEFVKKEYGSGPSSLFAFLKPKEKA